MYNKTIIIFDFCDIQNNHGLDNNKFIVPKEEYYSYLQVVKLIN